MTPPIIAAAGPLLSRYEVVFCDVWGVSGRSPNADVGLDIDRQGFLEVLMDCLARY